MTEQARHVVIVGASLAGLRTAEALRRAGYEHRISLIGAEQHLPYDRPPLSKQVLQGTRSEADIFFRAADDYDELAIDLHLGRAATSLDLTDRRVTLERGQHVAFDRLVIATGCAPRRLNVAEGLAGVQYLRTLDDCLAIREQLERRPRVVVIGGGFIGAEVAATARLQGLDVTIVEALPVPLTRAVGPTMGAACAGLHRDHGVVVLCGAGVSSIEGGQHVERVRLTDGTSLEADLVVVGIGASPAVEWLDGSGVQVGDGVLCDATGATSAPGVYAAGDVARWHSPLFDEDIRVEHWTNAAEQGAAVARSIVAGAQDAPPLASVPFFWSDQYDTTIQFVGQYGADEVQVVHGSLEDRRFLAVYRRGQHVVGALGFSAPRLVFRMRALIAERATWEDALRVAQEEA